MKGAQEVSGGVRQEVSGGVRPRLRCRGGRHLSESRPRGPEAEAREGVGCVPVEEMQALRASFPSSWDSAPWSVRVVPRELFHRDGVTLTERHVLVAPTHLANRHLLIAS